MATIVRVLMLTDADGSYVAHNNRFGLTELVDALEADAGDEWKFVVTKAHRYPKSLFESTYPNQQQGADSGKDHFVFDASFNTSTYDELWLLGIASSNPAGPYKDPSGYALQPAEVEFVQKFMDAGGGVFATGDHDDLGRDLCGLLPRVRSMRRWNFDYAKAKTDYSGYDEGSGDSPPVMGLHRHSTIVKDANGHFEFDNQSDDMPQTIRPEMTVVISGIPYVTITETFPHPLLCSTQGVIDVLPDHMHEGQCQIPSDLGGKYQSAGTSHDEYPTFWGKPLAPQVVAWEDIVGRPAQPGFTDPGKNHGGYDDNEPLESDTGGAIAAWDGHLVSRGRVVVDATFHHFMDVNMVGVAEDLRHGWTADESVKLLGLKNSLNPSAQSAYHRIRQYWRNIARWNAPPNLQISHGLTWIRKVAVDGRIRESLGLAHDLNGKLRLGAGMTRIMGIFLSPCATLQISGIGIPDPLSILMRNWFIIKNLPDPPPDGPSWKMLPVSIGTLSQLSLGVAASTLARLRSEGAHADDQRVLAAIHEANGHAIRELLSKQAEGYEHAARDAERWLRAAEVSRQ